MQADAVGSVIQVFIGDMSALSAVTSVVIDEHVALSHFAATTFGNVADAV